MAEDSSDEDCAVTGGDFSIPVFLSDRRITIPPEEAYGILQDADKTPKEKICLVPPQHPRGGEVYLFSSEGRVGHHDDFKADAYQWHTGGGGSMLPRSDPIVSRHYDRLIVAKHPKEPGEAKGSREHSSEFTRTWYRLITVSEETGKKEEMKNFTLVHYLGDQKMWVPLPHGNEKSRGSSKNSKKSDGNAATTISDYKRTAPSVLHELKDSHDMPQKVYGSMLTKKEVPPTMKPRDKKQVINHQHLMQVALRASNDEICSVVLFGLQLKDFVHRVILDLPNQAIGVYMISKDLCDMIRRILSLPKVAERAFQVQYDTTFKVGKFYFSMMSFRHPSFTNYPTIPFAFMVHTRKFQDMHNQLFELVKAACPKLGSSEFVFVTDREFRDVVDIFPKVKHVFCWRHIEADVESWVRSHRKGGSKDTREPTWYAKKVVELMHCENMDEFEQKLSSMKQIWSPGFIDYFEEHIKPDILKHANRWLLEELGAYRGGTYGITNNPAEGLNTMIKSLHRFKKTLRIDQVVMSMHFLSKFYDVEEQRGRAGMGNWRNKLCEEHEHYSLSDRQILDDNEFKSPDEVVKFVIESATDTIFDAINEGDSDSSEKSDVEAEEIEVDDDEKPTRGNSDKDRQEICIDEPTKTFDPDSTEEAKVKFDSQRTAALELVRSQRIKRMQLKDRSVFVVEGSKQAVHVVYLMPKETCSCPATRTCYHILAARMLEGQPLEERHGTLQLSQIMFKARKRHDRKQVKQPRKNDYLDVRAAPDSMLATSTPEKRKEQGFPRNFNRPSTVIEVEEPNENEDYNFGFANDRQQSAPPDDDQPFDEHDPDLGNRSRSRKLSEDTQEPVYGPVQKSRTKKINEKHCFCKTTIDSLYVQCTGCKEWYHQACVDVPQSALDDTNEVWLCPSCTLPTVVKWGGELDGFKLGNTCPIDNALSMFGMYFIRHPEAFDYLGSSNAEKALQLSARLFCGGRPGEAKAAWIKFLLDSGTIHRQEAKREIDVYGSEESRFYDFFRPLYHVRSTSACDSNTCSNPAMVHEHSKLILNEKDDVKDLVGISWGLCGQSISQADTGTSSLSREKCQGTRTYERITFTCSKPWLLVIDCISCTFEKAAKFPRNLEIDGMRFEFGGVSLHSGNHFTMLFDWGGRRFYFNAMGRSRRQIETVEHVASSLAKVKPNIAVYFRKE